MLAGGVLLVCGALAAPATAAVSFTQPAGSPFAVGDGPSSVAVGDFDGDGNPDLATANLNSNNVSVLIGDGSGGFTEPAGSPVPAGASPVSVAVGDFDGDGKPDLATANAGGSDDVSVLIGDGSGGFTEAAGSPVTVGVGPLSVAVGDFDGDGKPDLATANNFGNNVSVLIGDGSGGFTQPAGSPVAVANVPVSVAVGDFDGDGKPDLATADAGSAGVSVLIGDGSGGFTEGFAGVGNGPRSVAVGDFDGDGKPDLATANNGGAVSVLIGDGNGGFTQPAGSPFAVGDGPFSVAVGDFDGDGKPDLATANSNSSNVSVLIGDGSGGFTQPAGSPVTVGVGPVSVAVGDFDGDGRPDLATANQGSNVSVLLNGSTLFVPAAGSVLVSELRLSGPSGADDQFVELYNTSGTASVNVGGWSLEGSNNRSVPIAQGTVIPPFGHVLLTGPPNQSLAPAGYSLNGYGPSSLRLPFGAAVRFPQTNGGVRLVSPQGTTIDAAGFTGTGAGFFEGTPITQPGAFATGQQFSFARRMSAGAPVDTNVNSADFVEVDAGSGAGQAGFGTPLLGAPAPQGLSSPTQHNDILQSSLLDTGVSASASPNLVYAAGSPGTLVVNRKLTNCSGQPATGACANTPVRAAATVTRLRFRISDLTTTGTPGSTAKLVGVNSAGSTEAISAGGGGGTANVSGLSLDVPPSAAGLGGVGSSFTATTLLPGGGLAPGASLNVQFKFSVTQTGSYRFAYDSEADLIEPAGPVDAIAPAKTPPGPTEATHGQVTATAVTAVTTVAKRCKVPKLTGRTPRAAKRKLRHAHCKLGKVKKPKASKRLGSKFTVKTSRPKAGKTRAANTKITLILKRAPKPKHTKR